MTCPPVKRSKNMRTRVTMSGWLQNKSERRSLKILSPDFRLGLSTAALGFVLKNMFGASGMGLFFTILGGFFVLQTSRLRFCFGTDTFSVLRVSGLSESGYGNDLKPKSIQGGLSSNSTEGEGEEKRVTAIGPWSYGSIVEWRFWWPGFPLLAYFKETQTKETGQRHFIPMLMDGRSMYEQMQKNFGRSSQRLPDASKWNDLIPLTPRGYRLTKAKVKLYVHRMMRTLKLREWLNVIFQELKMLITKVKDALQSSDKSKLQDDVTAAVRTMWDKVSLLVGIKTAK